MRTSETFHPSHGIHVNPKYLEARHQFENPVTDNRHSREASSEIQVSGHKSFSKCNDHDLDHLVFQPPNLRMVREGSPQTLTLHGSSTVGQEVLFLNSQRKVATRVSPGRIGLKRSTSPQGQRLQRSSPGLMIETASRSQSGLEFKSHKASESNGWFGRSLAEDDGVQQLAALTTSNRYGRQRQRELIDAYGNYRDENFLHESVPKIQRADVNGIKGKAGKMDWQNSEEEEYLWEDMSPTLADPGKRSSTLFEQSTENFGLRANSSRPGIISEKSDFRRRSWPVPPLKDSTSTTDERNAIRDYGHESMNKMHPDDTGSSSEHFGHHEYSHHALEHSSLPHIFHHSMLDNFSPKSQGRPFQLPYLVGVTPSIIHKQHGLYDNSHNTEVPFIKLSSTLPESLNVEMPTLEKAYQSSLAPVTWPPIHKSQTLQLLHTPNLQVDNNKPIGNQKPNFFVPLSQPQFGANGRRLLKRSFQETHGGLNPPVLTQPPSGVQPHGQSGVLDSILSNPNSRISISSVQNLLDSSLHGRTGMPPLPPGPPPLLSQPLHTSQNGCSAASQPLVSGFSGLISSLMAQGLISLTPTAQIQNTVGLEFNAELLKIRHESAINAMYAELPRQCTTCGLRFTNQDDHSNHMDWHVTKNRISKNRKQKPSRKWFVSAKEWLCGAEALGADAVPGFLPPEAVPEKKEETEMTVPADENQINCALCGEPFEDFYSDETEEWMYRGAVYLNAPNGDIKALERSQLGPIVHVKCSSESVEGSVHV